jgi:hypothetical protein
MFVDLFLLASATKARRIFVCRFIIEYSSLRDFDPYQVIIIIGLFFYMRIFER